MGVVFLSHFPKSCRANQDIFATIRGWGAEFLPPDAAFALAAKYPQPALLDELNALRPKKSVEVGCAVVWHDYLTDSSGFQFLLGLDSSGVPPGPNGSVYPYRYAPMLTVPEEVSRRLDDPKLSAADRSRVIEQMREQYRGDWPYPTAKNGKRETAFLVRVPDL